MPPEKRRREKTPEQKEREAIVAKLAELGGKAIGEQDLEFGEKFMLPEKYREDLEGARVFLTGIERALEDQTTFEEHIPFKPWDTIYAMQNAFEKVFGSRGRQKGREMFLFSTTPSVRKVPSGPKGETITVPTEPVTIPAFKGTMEIVGCDNCGGCTMFIHAKKKYEGAALGIFKIVLAELLQNSMYRGKAIVGSEMPQFLDLTEFVPEDVVYNEITRRQLEANLWIPIRYPERIQARKVDPKRSILLRGEYGVGKTLTAKRTAFLCQEQSRTFIMAAAGDDDLFDVLRMAALYQPSCVFMEDIDKLIERHPGRLELFLEQFDGFISKGKDIISVMTTNNVKLIPKGMLRAGRFDAIIKLENFDRRAIETVIKRQFRGPNVDLTDVNFDRVFELMQDFQPAFVKETCEKVKLYQIERSIDSVSESEIYTTSDFEVAADEMAKHHQIHTGGASDPDHHPIEQGLTELVTDTLSDAKMIATGPGQFKLVFEKKD